MPSAVSASKISTILTYMILFSPIFRPTTPALSPGAFLFMWIELPKEELMRELKTEKSKEVDEAVAYLKSTFWHYATDEYRYNYTHEQFRTAAGEDLATLKTFVLTYAEDYGYDGTERWEYSWSFPKSLLFTITIITTIGLSEYYRYP